MTRRKPVVERFWAKVALGAPNECWVWQGAKTPKGYGLFKSWENNNRMSAAARVAWILTYGPIESSKQLVCHRCTTRLCVNPAHLYLGTYKSNTQDSIRLKTFSGFGRAGVNHPFAKFTEKDIQIVRASLLSNRALAKQFGCSGSVISEIRTRKTYVAC